MSQSNRDFAFGYLASKGVPAHVAAGIIGNLAVESDDFSSDVISGKRAGDKGKSKGVAQWNGDRLANLQSFAQAKGRDWRSLDTQLDFIGEELNPKSPYSDPQASKAAKSIFDAPDPKAAAQAFATHYERMDPNQAHMGRRTDIAMQSYDNHLSGPVAAPTPTSRDIGLHGAPQIASAPQMSRSLEAGYISPMGMFGDRMPSGFGGRAAPSTPQGPGSTNHRGVDLTAALGQGQYGYPAVSIAPGVVTQAGKKGGYGNFVEVEHFDGNRSRYGHLGSISVAVGDEVAQGIPIGTVGSTGKSTGPHLHLEVVDPLGRQINPADVIDFAQDRSVPTPTPAPSLSPAEFAASITGAPITSAPSISVPGQAPAFSVSDFGLNMGPAGQVAGLPANAVQTSSVAPGAQMASLPGLHDAPQIAAAPAAPSARSAEDASMAALASMQDQIASNRVDQDHAVAAAAPAPSIADSHVAQAHTDPMYSVDIAQAFGPTSAPQGPVAITSADALAGLAGAPQISEDEAIDMGTGWATVPGIAQPDVLAQAPVAVQAPVQAPVAVPAIAQAPAVQSAPAPSMPSGLDFWGGNANVAVSNAGNHLSRDVHGNTYNFSPDHNITTISNQAGDVIGTRSGPVDVDTSGKASGGGIFSGGIFSGDGMFSGGNVQNAVAGGIGSIGGGFIGNMIGGPVLGILGSAFGRNLAVNHFGVPQVQDLGFINPAIIDAARRGFTPGLGFPDAPGLTGKEWGGWTDGSGFGSRGYAESISPGATAAIDSGKGGLY